MKKTRIVVVLLVGIMLVSGMACDNGLLDNGLPDIGGGDKKLGESYTFEVGEKKIRVTVHDYILTDSYGCWGANVWYGTPESELKWWQSVRTWDCTQTSADWATFLCVKSTSRNVGVLPVGLPYQVVKYGGSQMFIVDDCPTFGPGCQTASPGNGYIVIENTQYLAYGEESALENGKLNPGESVTTYRCWEIPKNPDISSLSLDICTSPPAFSDDTEKVRWKLTN